ncbi:MAG: ATP-dependent Clp protease adaptor ClpS [Bacteroidota bacterium]
MTLKDKTKQKQITWDSVDHEKYKKYFLILHNDEVNTFEHVIECLTDICKHDKIQAEQCAYITHYKGKCDVKKGTMEILKPIREKLIKRGLNVTID